MRQIMRVIFVNAPWIACGLLACTLLAIAVIKGDICLTIGKDGPSRWTYAVRAADFQREGMILAITFGDLHQNYRSGTPAGPLGFAWSWSSSQKRYNSSRHATYTLPPEFIGIIPYWFAILGLSIAAIYGAVRCHRRAWRPGLCRNCSYDLRSHAPGDKCPECGTPVPTPSRPSAPVKGPVP